MKNEGTVTITIKRFKELEAQEIISKELSNYNTIEVIYGKYDSDYNIRVLSKDEKVQAQHLEIESLIIKKKELIVERESLREKVESLEQQLNNIHKPWFKRLIKKYEN